MVKHNAEIPEIVQPIKLNFPYGDKVEGSINIPVPIWLPITIAKTDQNPIFFDDMFFKITNLNI